MVFAVRVRHDEGDGVWYVESSDVPGLHAEAPSFDALVEAITDVVPDLVETNVPGFDLAGAISIPLRVDSIH